MDRCRSDWSGPDVKTRACGSVTTSSRFGRRGFFFLLRISRSCSSWWPLGSHFGIFYIYTDASAGSFPPRKVRYLHRKLTLTPKFNIADRKKISLLKSSLDLANGVDQINSKFKTFGVARTFWFCLVDWSSFYPKLNILRDASGCFALSWIYHTILSKNKMK